MALADQFQKMAAIVPACAIERWHKAEDEQENIYCDSSLGRIRSACPMSHAP